MGSWDLVYRFLKGRLSNGVSGGLTDLSESVSQPTWLPPCIGGTRLPFHCWLFHALLIFTMINDIVESEKLEKFLECLIWCCEYEDWR